MPDLTKASRRTVIQAGEAQDIARLARPGDPGFLARGEIEDALGDGSLILDGLRRRPRWFDGRFLTGSDLTRDQDYIRQRQADLARATGMGVVAGLRVRASGDARGAGLLLESGHGVTPSGELVMIEETRSVALLDLAEIRRLDATLGLRLEPRAPLGRRTGLFVLGLRPVEWTSNEIAAYPTSLDGPRRAEDADIVEATAITLVPWRVGEPGGLDELRRETARDIFMGDAKGLPQDVLPLAMLALDRGALRWIDMAMVRRETGADTPLQVSLGARPRSLSEAFLIQHRAHLEDVTRARRAAGRPDAFAASQSFALLPPFGPMPAAAVRPQVDGFRHLWFPPEVEVTLAFAPEDEIAAMAEESLALPPLDLAQKGALDGVGVTVLAPVSRARLARFEAALATLTVVAAPGADTGSKRRPVDALSALLGKRALRLAPATPTGLTEAETAELRAWAAAWTEAVNALPTQEGLPPMLWYMRRRAVPRTATLTGVAVPISGDDARTDEAVRDRAAELGLTDRLEALADGATSAAAARMIAFLAAPSLLASAALTSEAVTLLEAAMPADDGGDGDGGGEGDGGGGGGVTPGGGGVITSGRGTLTTPISTRDVLTGLSAASTTRLGSLSPIAVTRLDRTLLSARDTAVVSRLGITTDVARRDALTVRTGLERLAVSRILRDGSGDDGGGPSVLTEADVLDIAADFDLPDLGLGLAALADARGEAMPQAAEIWIGGERQALAADRLALRLDPSARGDFAAALAAAAEAQDADALAQAFEDAL